jgi:hypothetical protein
MIFEKTPNITTYFWNSFECEICKTTFPFKFKCNGSFFSLVDIEKPKENDYLIIDLFCLKKNATKLVYVLTPQT